jgi:hypothetical protein
MQLFVESINTIRDIIVTSLLFLLAGAPNPTISFIIIIIEVFSLFFTLVILIITSTPFQKLWRKISNKPPEKIEDSFVTKLWKGWKQTEGDTFAQKIRILLTPILPNGKIQNINATLISMNEVLQTETIIENEKY